MENAPNRILWWCFVASLLIYVGVAYLVAVPATSHTAQPVLVVVFGLLSAAIGIASLIYRRHALSGPIQRGALNPMTPDGLQKAFPPFVVNLALSESVAIFGLVLALLAGQGAYSIPFILAALALLYAHRPTAPDLLPPVGGSEAPARPTPIG